MKLYGAYTNNLVIIIEPFLQMLQTWEGDEKYN